MKQGTMTLEMVEGDQIMNNQQENDIKFIYFANRTRNTYYRPTYMTDLSNCYRPKTIRIIFIIFPWRSRVHTKRFEIKRQVVRSLL